PWRILDIMRSNACLVSDYHKDFDKFFPEDLFPVYEDEYEAREICKELLVDESKRRKIVRRCQNFAVENFSFDRIAKSVNELIGDKIL
ncbi:MAG: glycosyltransferase family 1 protein, partial [Selenomonadaceae bacterium]|nr:glycosyltransferase family 1 protein [Selenomonadaceae bacterium]